MPSQPTPPSRGRPGVRPGGRLLLFVALLFGIVGMHTLGHPTGHGMEHGIAHGTTARHSMEAPAVAHAAPVTTRKHERPGDGGMDPLSVCLAVLGSFTLLLLLATAPLRPAATVVLSAARRGLSHAHRPHPPPPRTTLSLLSVLRI
ncbi:DUF6153 family protein [Streptomyces sp. NPDC059639]|uniref:DUF6153 family protein n=1 Tax=Streptomyces sp. NPDC059639 TaxID=3346891 RepID=UPI0036896D99